MRSLIFILSFFSFGLFAGYYGYDPTQNIYSGAGLNPFFPDKNYTQCVPPFTEEQITPPGLTKVEMSLLKTREDFFKYTSLSASASAKYSIFSGQGSMSKIEMANFHSDTLNFLVVFKTDYGLWGNKFIDLDPKIKALPRKNIFARCGTEIVQNVRRTATLYALLSVSHLSNEQYKSFSAKFGASVNAGVWGGKVEGQYNSLIKSLSQSMRVSLSVEALGGNGVTDLGGLLGNGNDGEFTYIDYLKLPKVMAKYLEGMTADKATPTMFYTINVSSLLDDPTPSIYDDFKHKEVEKLYGKYLDHHNILERVREIVRTSKVLPSNVRDFLIQIGNQCKDVMALSEKHIKKCFNIETQGECVDFPVKTPILEWEKYRQYL